jgi:4-amino-4-deoxy-L-arabinose transferase-like glycosyltransferase
MAVVAWFGSRLFGSPAGWVAGLATGAAPLTLGLARTVIFDATLTFFVVLALAAFHRAAEERATWPWTAIAWAAVGFAILTKGPIGLALPLMVAAPYAAWRGASASIWTPLGPLVCVAIVLPWLVAVSPDLPDLIPYALVTETAERLFTERLQRSEPVWYFPPILLAGALPWSALVLAGWATARPLRLPDGARDPRTVFLLMWILIPLAFFTVSESKRPQYLLPIMPAAALLTARMWRSDRVPGARAAALTLGGAAAVLGLAPLIVPRLLEVSSDVARAIPRTAVPIAGATALAAATLWIGRRHGNLVLAGLAVPTAVIPLASRDLMQAIGRERSAAALAEAIRPAVEPAGQVVAIGTFPLSLPFYLQRPVLLATESGEELTSTYLTRRFDRWRGSPGTPLRPRDWWREAMHDCRARVFVVRAEDRAARSVLESRLPLLVETPRHAAYGPCGGSSLATPG